MRIFWYNHRSKGMFNINALNIKLTIWSKITKCHKSPKYLEPENYTKSLPCTNKQINRKHHFIKGKNEANSYRFLPTTNRSSRVRNIQKDTFQFLILNPNLPLTPTPILYSLTLQGKAAESSINETNEATATQILIWIDIY